MRELIPGKQTINFERKMHYKNNQRPTEKQKELNLKRAISFGHIKKDNIEKYGLRQCLERCEDYCELSA